MKKLLVSLTLMSCVSVALAEPPARGSAEALVERKVIAPLEKAEAKRRRFSRAMSVPVERRVRVLDAVAITDSRGQQFVRFAVDARRGWDDAPWESDALVGCAYLDRGEVFVRVEDAYYPAKVVLGSEEGERPGVCRPAGELPQG